MNNQEMLLTDEERAAFVEGWAKLPQKYGDMYEVAEAICKAQLIKAEPIIRAEERNLIRRILSKSLLEK